MISMGKRLIGDGQPCFITFEAGPTHDGIGAALHLAELACNAGADAIKFQVLDPDRLVADRKLLFSYEVLLDRATGKTEKIDEPLYDILCRRVLTRDEWRKLKRRCDEIGIAFFATATFEDELDLLVELNCDSIKIASADVNHFPFIRKAARSGLSVQLDTGNATLGEVEAAVDVVLAEGNDKIIIHHCPSGYPAHLESINLRVIPTLKRMFPFPIAFSDHTPGWEMDIAALALGANMLEKTITLDRTTRSVEHMFSLEPRDMSTFVRSIRDVETALGDTRRKLHPQEMENRRKYRRSTWLPDGGKAGERLADVAVEFRRPGFGVSPDLYEHLASMRLKQDQPPDHLLSLGDLEDGGL